MSTGDGGRPELRAFVVRSHRGSYEVRRAAIADALPSGLGPSDRLIVDRSVQRLHPGVSLLAGDDQTFCVTADEQLKSLDGVLSVLTWLLESGFGRGGTLHAIGGGTVQDVACFVASILHRGCQWVFVPTTLIAQGDSCIGSKSSINHGGYKNQLGTFFPPAKVIIDEAFLTTLPPREVQSGVGEMLHYAPLGDEATFAAYEAALAGGWRQIASRELVTLAMLSLGVKQPYVELDEFDAGPRKVLNLGHTFGHALEFGGGGAIAHGVAVAYGIDMASRYAHQRGILDAAGRSRIARLVRKVVDGGEIASVTGECMLDGMRRDKKRAGEDIELVLVEGIGKPVRVTVPLDERLVAFLDNCLAGWQAAAITGETDIG